MGAVKVPFVTFTKKGKSWIRVKGSQPHKEVLDLAYDDAGGLKQIGYLIDPAAVKDGLWDYLKKAAIARFGETDTSSDLVTFKVSGVKELRVHKVDAKTLSIDVEL